MEPQRTYMNHIKPCICSTCIERLEVIRQEERERAQKIIEEMWFEPLETCDCGDVENCKWTEGNNHAIAMAELQKKHALKKLNIDSYLC